MKLDQWFASSKRCSDCGHKMADMPLHQRNWACPACGAEHDRDINAVMNIQRQGILELKGSVTRRFSPSRPA
ncbi:zinc ribbon domain-containing protein [Aeromonas media]|uniref:zinc ribbon domain-containing protein n=1 Tax=Aeromonas media TaxID=651 RepID=UPI001C609CCF